MCLPQSHILKLTRSRIVMPNQLIQPVERRLVKTLGRNLVVGENSRIGSPGCDRCTAFSGHCACATRAGVERASYVIVGKGSRERSACRKIAGAFRVRWHRHDVTGSPAPDPISLAGHEKESFALPDRAPEARTH